MKQDVNNLKVGINRREFVGLGLGVLTSTLAAQDGIGQTRTSDGKSPSALRSHVELKLENGLDPFYLHFTCTFTQVFDL